MLTLSFPESLDSNIGLTLKDLSLKLSMLLTLTAMERISEIDLQYHHYSSSGVTFHDLPDLQRSRDSVWRNVRGNTKDGQRDFGLLTFNT